ncbi:hypothetical protein [Sporisorium scitamineum]|uniref:Uncharacterized protein n=1 Tax=Sporisorium scitamineum TaxID=49012 RepID=A0A0F7RW40_9BASI|nr:hypothetical protein [Sporisorium scitamineum]
MTSAEMGTLTHPVASGSVPQVEKEDGQADWNSSNFDGRQSVQSLASAFDFTCLPGPQTVTASTTASPPSITPRVRSACRGCGHVYPRCACSAPLTRNSTSMGTLPVPVRIATPAPGWLNPEVDPNELPIGTSGRLQQVTSASGDWSFLANGSNAWSFTTTTATGSRYEPYRSPSIASTASNSTQGIFSPSPAQSGQRLSVHEGAGGRRRSSTVGSLPGLSSGLVDRTPTILQANMLGDVVVSGDTTMESNKAQAKIAVHHHRTKLQRNVLNEVVTSLQGAYKHCRRQYSTDKNGDSVEQYSLILGGDPWRDEGDAENRQKAESKMRMRRKEVTQFAALTTYAKMAYDFVDASEAAVDSGLKLGLQELFVKKLAEKLVKMSTVVAA